MTKTIKKGLVACLIALLAVLVGVTASAWGEANAADPTNTDKFIAAIQDMRTGFDVKDDAAIAALTKEKLFPAEPTKEIQNGWNAYVVAQGLVANVLTDAEITNIKNSNKSDWALYEKVDNLFSDALAVYGFATSSLYNIVNAPSKTYSDNTIVLSAEQSYNALTANEKKFIDLTTKYAANLEAAKARMAVIKEKIDLAIAAINNIEFYCDDDYAMVKHSEKAADKSYRIVVDSNVAESNGSARTTIDAAKEIIDEVLDPNDVELFVTNHDVYDSAVAAYDLLLAEASDVDEKIMEINDKVNADTCYTLKDEILAVQAMYEALAGAGKVAWDRADWDAEGVTAYNYNNLQNCVYSHNILDGLLTRLNNIEGQIQGVIDAITAIGEPEYTVECFDKIKNAEALFDNLDKDITDHDIAEFAKTEGVKEYFVTNYEDMKAARAQYDAWDKEVTDLAARVEAMLKEDSLNHSIYEEYYAVLDLYGLNEDAAKLTKAQREILAAKQVSNYKNGIANGKISVDEAMEKLGATVGKALAATKALDSKINNTYNDFVIAQLCAFGARNIIGWRNNYSDQAYMSEGYLTDEGAVGYWQEYLKLDLKTREYVQNIGLLEEMLKEVDDEMAIVNAWYNSLENLPELIKVTNWNIVDNATDMWNALIHSGEVLPADALGKLQTIVSTDTVANGVPAGKYATYKAAYEAYKAAVEAEKLLKDTIAALDEKMKAIECKADLALTEAVAFHDQVAEATAIFEDLAKNDVTAEWMAQNHKEAWDNYQKALTYDKRYGVESVIDHLYENNTPDDPTDYEQNAQTLVDNNIITLAVGGAIRDARAMYNAYITEVAGATENDIRNYSKLVAAEDALELIAADLDAWMCTVVRLDEAYAEFEDTNGIKAAITDITANFKGYPLNLESYATVLAAYADVTKTGGNNDENKVVYVAEAKTLLDTMNKLGGKGVSEDTNVIYSLNNRIQAINTKLANGETLNAEDLAEVKAIKDLYAKLHSTQQAEITNIEDMQAAADMLAAQEAFKNMLEELYRDVVTNGNVTSLSKYNLAVIEAIYDGFTDAIKATFTDYNTKVAAIRDTINAAETVLSLNGVEAEIQDAITEIVNAFKGTENATTITEAIAKFEQKLTGAYTKAVNDAINALKNGEIKTLQENLNKLESELGKALDKNQDGFAKEIYDEINSLKAAIEAANAKIAELEALKAAVEAAATKEELASLDQKLAGNLNNLKTELKGEIEDVNTALATLEEKLRTEMNAADTKLQEQIDSMKSSITTLTVLIIVIAVLLIAAIASVVVLFLKRRNS